MPVVRANRIALLALITAQLLFLGFHLVYGRFLGWDEMGYKAVGRGWATTGHWTAPELEGAYWPLSWHCRPPAPPLYSLAFGIYVRIFGLSFRTNAMFDALIQVALSWIVFAVARTLDRDGPSWPAAVAAIAILPLGNPGRPEAMGMTLGFLGWLAAKRATTAKHWLAAGLLEGLAATTSVASGFFIGLLVLLRRNRIRDTAVWMAAAAAVFLPIMLILDWHTLHSAGSGMGTMAAAAASRSLKWLIEAFQFGRTAGWAEIAMLVPIALAGWKWKQRSLWLVPVAIQLAIPLLFPREFYYIWIMAPVMLGITMIVIERSPRRWPALLALPIYLFAISRVLLLHAALVTLPPDQRIDANVKLIHSIIPRTSTIMTYDYWPALGNEYRLYSTDARPDWQTVDYIVLTGNGSGAPGKRQLLPDDRDLHAQREYTIVADRLNREPFHLGPIHTHSAYGFGPMILRRIRQPGQSNESAHVQTTCYP